jgi:5-formyltetrahydrofolate cyclo-ligase
MIEGEKQRLRERMRILAAENSRGEAPLSLSSLFRFPLLSGSSSVLLYAPIAGEPDPTSVMEFPAIRSFLFPRISGDDLKIYRWTPHSLWIAGPFGIREPDPENWESASPEEIDLALIPGLAFDPMGGRLGRGKGFYDRLLGNPAFRGIKVGLAWEWQLVDEVPGEAHDIRMDIVIAGKKIHDPGSMLDKPGERG